MPEVQRNLAAVVLLLTVMMLRLPGAGMTLPASHSSVVASVPSIATGNESNWPDQSPLLNFAWYTRVSLEIEPEFTDADEAEATRATISLNALVSWACKVSALVTRK